VAACSVLTASNDRQPGASGEPGQAYPALCHHTERASMAMNPIQFQHGLLLAAVRNRGNLAEKSAGRQRGANVS